MFSEIFKAEEQDRAPIPLVSVDITAAVFHCVAQVKVIQIYLNKEEKPVDAVYYFPISSDGVVTDFQAEYDGNLVKGVVKPKEDAEKGYSDTVANYKPSFLGDVTGDNIFKIRLGFLEPKSRVKVTICYDTKVKNELGTDIIRFCIPTVISQTHIFPKSYSKDNNSLLFSTKPSVPLTLTVDVNLPEKIKMVESPTHKLKIVRNGPVIMPAAWYKAIIEVEGTTADLDHDFVLNIKPDKCLKSALYSETGEDGSTIMLLRLIPSFHLENKTELIFLVDRSGSMQGQSLELARRTLLTFLNLMPTSCSFNIVGFGSTHEFLFPQSVHNSQEYLDQAITHATNLEADLGGKELLEPLLAIYKEVEDAPKKALFVITEGDIWESERVIHFVKKNVSRVHLYALGIGDESKDFIEKVSKAGGGRHVMLSHNERVDKKITTLMIDAGISHLTYLSLEWDDVSWIEEKLVSKYRQIPKEIPVLFEGSQLFLFRKFQNKCPKWVTLKGEGPEGPFSLTFKGYELNDLGIIRRLAALTLMNEAEPGSNAGQSDSIKREIIGTACKVGVNSALKATIKHTPFKKVPGLGILRYVAAEKVGQNMEEELNTHLVQKIEDNAKTKIIQIAVENGIGSRYTSFVIADFEEDLQDEESEDDQRKRFDLKSAASASTQLFHTKSKGSVSPVEDYKIL